MRQRPLLRGFANPSPRRMFTNDDIPRKNLAPRGTGSRIALELTGIPPLAPKQHGRTPSTESGQTRAFAFHFETSAANRSLRMPGFSARG